MCWPFLCVITSFLCCLTCFHAASIDEEAHMRAPPANDLVLVEVQKAKKAPIDSDAVIIECVKSERH